MHRVIDGLKWAKMAERPNGLPIGRPRGAKRMGVRYERLVAEALPMARHGQWFQFEDKNGVGWCQVDLLSELPSAMVVFEVKYTWVPEGHSQIDLLYRPVVECAMGKKVVGVVICRNTTPAAAPPFIRLDDALRATMRGENRVVLQWLGTGPLIRQALPARLASRAMA